jgi:hypothetical protein
MARALAEVIAGFAADCAHRQPAPRTLHVVELGAGSARLGWNIVRALRHAIAAAAPGWRIVYVLTDIAEETIAWWQAHPQLAPLIADGVLDVARFDATRDRTLELRASGRVLDPSDPADELVVIANYVFDGLPTDVFVARDGALHECLVRVDPGPSEPGAGIATVEAEWRTRPAPARSYPDDRHQRILEQFASLDGVFAFPCAALGALDRLRALSRGPLLVLSSDKGAVRLDEVLGDMAPAFACHGSVSVDVNYAALGAWTLACGGTMLHNEHHHRVLEVCALVLGLDGRAATAAAFERAIAQRGPDDFHAIKRLLVERAGELTPRELLAYLRLSGYDAKLALDVTTALLLAAVHVVGEERDDLELAIARIWDGYLAIGEGDAVVRLLRDLRRRLAEPRPQIVADEFDGLLGPSQRRAA